VLIINNTQLYERTLSTSYLYRGRIINVRQDRVKVHNGNTAFREIVEHPGAVAVLAVDQKDRIIMVKQFRQPAQKVLLEIPAGKLEPGESPLACARREFAEETAMEAKQWKQVAAFYPSPGFCDEIIYLYYATGIKDAVSPVTDPDENIELSPVKLEKASAMIQNGQIVDGKTIIAIQHALLYLK
jgi:ADP-ribose pyrophosphatase